MTASISLSQDLTIHHVSSCLLTLTDGLRPCRDSGECPKWANMEIGNVKNIMRHQRNREMRTRNIFTVCWSGCPLFPFVSAPIFSRPRSDFDKIFVSINVLKSAIFTRFLLDRRFPFDDEESPASPIFSTLFWTVNGADVVVTVVEGSLISISFGVRELLLGLSRLLPEPWYSEISICGIGNEFDRRRGSRGGWMLSSLMSRKLRKWERRRNRMNWISIIISHTLYERTIDKILICQRTNTFNKCLNGAVG